MVLLFLFAVPTGKIISSGSILDEQGPKIQLRLNPKTDVSLEVQVRDTPKYGGRILSSASSLINITSDSDFATYALSGDGTFGNPYLIENYYILANGSTGVIIQDTTAAFILRNITVVGGDSGFYFYNVTNGLVEDSVAINNTNYGFFLWRYSHDNTFINNTALNNFRMGFLLSSYNNNNTFINNTALNNNDNGFHLYQSSNNTFLNNNAYNNAKYGLGLIRAPNNVFINNTLVNDSMVVSGNTITDLVQSRVEGNTVNSKPLSYLQNVVDGTISIDSGQVILVNSSGVLVENQVLADADLGLQMIFSNNNTILNTTVSNNGQHGFSIYASSNNTFSNSIVCNNGQHGFFLDKSNNNTFSNSIVCNNGQHGFSIYASSNNTFLNNNVSYNQYLGFYLQQSSNNTFASNVAAYNGLSGFLTWSFSVENVFTDNLVYNNTEYGFDLEDYSINNTFINNTGFNNGLGSMKITSSSTGNVLTDNNFDNHVLSVPTLTNPNGGESLVRMVTITWQVVTDSLNHVINYDLYYSNDSGITWSLLANGLAVTSYDWDTTSFANGTTYRVKIVAHDDYGTRVVDVSDADFTIDNPLHALSIPLVTNPNGDETLNGTVTITWQASTDSWSHSVSYDLYYSNDSGITWSLLAKGLTTTSYQWNTNSIPDGTTYRVKVVAKDGKGLTAEDTSTTDFTIMNAPSTMTSMPTTTSPQSSSTTTTLTSSSSTSSETSSTVKQSPSAIDPVIIVLLLVIIITSSSMGGFFIWKRRLKKRGSASE